jgi:DNA primase catalytic subunit
MAIAHEERLHAKWINTLSKYVKDGKIAFEKTQITTQSIKTAIDYIEKQKNKTLREKPDLKQCLNIAINIEKALLENAFFRVFKLDVPATQKIRTRLEEETKVHMKKLIEWRERIIKS